MIDRLYIIAALVLLTFLYGCSAEDEPLSPPDVPGQNDGRIEMSLNVVAPLPSLPKSRAVTNDETIAGYSVWVFNDEKFVEEIRDTDTCTDKKGTTKPMVRITADGTMYILLKEEYRKVRLMMIANATTNSPAIGDTWSVVENRLASTINFRYDGGTADMTDIPFFGTNDKEFAVALGADGGVIQLIRAMARIDVNASYTDGHFVMEEIAVYHANADGTIHRQKNGTITARDANNVVKGSVNQDGPDENGFYHGTVFIPEIGGIANNKSGTNTFVIVKGRFKSYTSNNEATRYYRWDFIKREETTAGVKYSVLDEIERNHRYIFTIEYITPTAGYATLNEALTGSPDNMIDLTQTRLAIINQKEIMSITTDNYIYLGVTSDKLNAKPGEDSKNYYWVQFYALTNNPDGWSIDYLPEGVSVTRSEWRGNVEEAASVIVWLDSTYKPGDTVSLYVFSGRIRKVITITIPQTP